MDKILYLVYVTGINKTISGILGPLENLNKLKAEGKR